ncbi:MAG TPA: DinB family protein [Dehalococcoidia bacterium]|nr:DinB family protein [Dehalococcoidia bacterium]
MKPDEAMTLYEYAWWARDRLLTAADGISDEEFGRDNGFTYSSLRGILVHAMDAEASWCSRFLREEVKRPPGDGELLSVAALRERWALEETRLRRFLADVTEVALTDDFVFQRRNGQEIRTPLWVLLTHVVNHGTQHRSEAAEALTMVGRSPGSLDFTTYVWE